MSFEEALSALEAIVQQLERGDVPLDTSINLYERGEQLRVACQRRLEAAQTRIEKIVTITDENGNILTRGTAPLDEDR